MPIVNKLMGYNLFKWIKLARFQSRSLLVVVNVGFFFHHQNFVSMGHHMVDPFAHFCLPLPSLVTALLFSISMCYCLVCLLFYFLLLIIFLDSTDDGYHVVCLWLISLIKVFPCCHTEIFYHFYVWIVFHCICITFFFIYLLIVT